MLRGILRVAQDTLLFWCPGCRAFHTVGRVGWSFNENYDEPTFLPSIKVESGHYIPGWSGPGCYCTTEATDDPDRFVCRRCHSYVTDGCIKFLPDSTHQLAGQTVALTCPPELD